ncbi:helix-turn-helix transcriptional regulator [Oleispirillum naphthae]|uniref:helix-turn-helix domain-containing protein n=1 Tax=Oleispirillum naphthae TaxID=2838853 RepID=UPI0030823864
MKMDAKQLKAWRKNLGLSQKEAAEALGLKRRIFQYYEKGERDGEAVKVPKTVRLACWALAHGVTDYLGPEPADDKKKAEKPKKPEKPAKSEKAEKKAEKPVEQPAAPPPPPAPVPAAPVAAKPAPAPAPAAAKPAAKPAAKSAAAKPAAKPAAK